MDSAVFVRADSTNLPSIDVFTLLEFMKTSDKYNVAEIRGAKAMMSARESYVENAVGYVEVHRNGNNCYVRAKVVPEHKISNTAYMVSVHIENNVIVNTSCNGCAAAAGGCKHTLVFLYWLEKRSAEPSTTSVKNYWVKPGLASARTEVVESKAIFKTKPLQLKPKDASVLTKFRAEAVKNGSKGVIMNYGPCKSETLTDFCVFDLMLNFLNDETDHSYENFKLYSSKKIEGQLIKINDETASQVKSKLWHCMRQGRITGSKIHEIAHCQTPDGSLVEEILGGYKHEETKAMKRGKLLEKKVISQLERELNLKICDAGFMLINGLIGASPDGITDDFIVEVKCPIKKQTLENYISKGKVTPKCMGQIQLGMLAAQKRKCLFVVADPNYEQNSKIDKVFVEYDSYYIENLVKQAELFWKTNIFPKILNSAMS